MWIQTFILLIAALPAAVPWETERPKPMPRLYGDMIPASALMTSSRKVQKKITLFHNFFRTRVRPFASNMLLMKWHEGAAKAAQRWAENCYGLDHENSTGRHVDNFGTCGQNIFISTTKVPWYFTVKAWFNERHDFRYGANEANDIKKIGHYTQIVWATTHKVGCGWAKCGGDRGPRGRPYFSYVCNYCPTGNYVNRLGTPYKSGAPCTSCKNHCHLNLLCKNACPWTDIWSNCRELADTWRGWLCETNTTEGYERRKFCRASCNCQDKIYE